MRSRFSPSGQRVASWCFVCVLAVVASCAQGSNDSADDAGTALTLDAQGASVSASGVDAGAGYPAAMDAGDPVSAGQEGGGPDAGAATDPGGAAVDAGSDGDAADLHADAATDAQSDAGAAGDAGNDSGEAADDSGGAGDAGSVVPTTCAQADGLYGCCIGQDLYYCLSGTVIEQTCKNGRVCGWSASNAYYGCVAPPGGADPSGIYPIACE